MISIELTEENAGMLLAHVRSQIHSVEAMVDKSGAVAFEVMMRGIEAQLTGNDVADPFEKLHQENEEEAAAKEAAQE